MADNDIRFAFQEYLNAYNTPNSRKAASYIRAIELIQEALVSHPDAIGTSDDLYTMDAETLETVRDMVARQRTLPNEGIFAELQSKSYLRKNFCSAALGELIRYRRLEDAVTESVSSTARADDVAETLSKRAAAITLSETDASGENVTRSVSVRRNQYIFRRMILRLYKGRCAVTGLAVPEILRASHIIPWAQDETNRLNPENGICLSATYDAAFDRNLISFDCDYRLILSPALLRHADGEAFEQTFLSYEGRSLSLPEKFLPSQDFLGKHRKKLFAL